MTEAARRSLRVLDGLEAVEEWKAQHGALTQRELDDARRRVRQAHGQAPKRRRSRAR